ncbi:hypothetical protein BOX15_Mlig016336g1, partial [Macrostomum lignano]
RADRRQSGCPAGVRSGYSAAAAGRGARRPPAQPAVPPAVPAGLISCQQVVLSLFNSGSGSGGDGGFGGQPEAEAKNLGPVGGKSAEKLRTLQTNSATAAAAAAAAAAGGLQKRARCQYCGKPFANKGQVRLHISKGKCPRLMASFPATCMPPLPAPQIPRRWSACGP